jgi:ParB-like chromosome segregation protein Spo0J
VKVDFWPIEALVPYELNAKKHDKEQVSKIAASIEKFGWRGNPIVVDKEGVIIAGHGRRLAAIELGMAKVPVHVAADLSEEEVRALRLADNRVAVSDIDTTLLQEDLATLEYDLSGIFDEKELDFMTADLGEMNDDVFVDSLEESVKEHTAEAVAKVEETDSREVPIVKALGFRAVAGKDERHVVGFMALIEKQFNMPADRAFVEFAKQMVAASS